ncbi:MAG: hypothetical protein QOC96_3626, partial [Acidobacteriota bacterium]|nr:hypothetical protein [Acidobacteriota bacterium]
MKCNQCQGSLVRNGYTSKGYQRYRCRSCQRTLIDLRKRPLGGMRLSYDKALLCLNLLVEGNSIRSIERITGVGKRAILSLLKLVGRKCEDLLDRHIKGVEVKDVQADEIWGFVWCKQKTKNSKGYGEECGDIYCFVAMERNSKLVLAWHLGQRTTEDTEAFTEKLDRATSGRFQLTT